MENCLSSARLLSKTLEASEWYVCVSDVHRKRGDFSFRGTAEEIYGKEDETSADYNAGFPVVAFEFSDEFKRNYAHGKQECVSSLMRAKQYIIPNYPLTSTEQATEIRRVVVRESMSLDLHDRLITDIFAGTQQLMVTDPVDLALSQPDATTLEKHTLTRPMSDGVHRGVC